MLGDILLPSVVHALCKTLRVEIVNDSSVKEMIAKKKSFVLAFWHGTMMLPWFVHRDKGMMGITSSSKDGDLLAKLLKKWNYKVVRGSSSKGGNEALEMMIEYATKEGTVMITPDGPRGPAFEMKAGAVVVAKKSNVPLILLGVGVQKKKKLHSWDSFEIPKPFSKVRLIYSEQINIEYDSTYEETSVIIKKCEHEMNVLQTKANDFA